MLYRESGGTSSQSCDKATLIKEKFYNKRKRGKIYNRDVLTHRHPR